MLLNFDEEEKKLLLMALSDFIRDNLDVEEVNALYDKIDKIDGTI